MSRLVSASEIEVIVGCLRRERVHVGRAVGAEGVLYILHSRRCFNSGRDLRECEYSLALDRGIAEACWLGVSDRPVELAIRDGHLVPYEVIGRA